MKKPLYVIKFANGQYSCGLKKFSDQLRHAQIYVSKKLAEEQADHYINLIDDYTHKRVAPTDSFEIVEIIIKEKKPTNIIGDILFYLDVHKDFDASDFGKFLAELGEKYSDEL